MMAASASFATPIGYQTDLMVYGPGGYRFSNSARIGIVLCIALGVLAVMLVPLIWPFQLLLEFSASGVEGIAGVSPGQPRCP